MGKSETVFAERVSGKKKNPHGTSLDANKGISPEQEGNDTEEHTDPALLAALKDELEIELRLQAKKKAEKNRAGGKGSDGNDGDGREEPQNQDVDTKNFGNPFKKLDSNKNLNGLQEDIAREMQKQAASKEPPIIIEMGNSTRERKPEQVELELKTRKEEILPAENRLPQDARSKQNFENFSPLLRGTEDFNSLLKAVENAGVFSRRDLAHLKARIDTARVNLFGKDGFVKKRTEFFSKGGDVSLSDIENSAIRGKVWELLSAEWRKRYPQEAELVLSAESTVKPEDESAKPKGKERELAKEMMEKVEKLKNRSVEIEYPGTPIGIEIGGKKFQIIDVRNDPQWKADYLLVDSDVYEKLQEESREISKNLRGQDFKNNVRMLASEKLFASNKGFKGIRENEPFVVGRDSAHRFKDLPETVAGVHMKVELRNGKIFIEDLGAGTTVSYDAPKETETAESAEADAAAGKSIEQPAATSPKRTDEPRMNEDGTWENIGEEQTSEQPAATSPKRTDEPRMNEDGTWENIGEEQTSEAEPAAQAENAAEADSGKIKEMYDASIDAARRYNRETRLGVLEGLKAEYEQVLAAIESNAKEMIVVEEEKNAAQESLKARELDIEKQKRSLYARLGAFFKGKNAESQVDVNLLRELGQYREYYEAKVAESDELRAKHETLERQRDSLKNRIDELMLEINENPGQGSGEGVSTERAGTSAEKSEDEKSKTVEIPKRTLEGYASLGIDVLELEDAFSDIAALSEEEHERVLYKVKQIKNLAGAENELLLANIGEIIKSVRSESTEESEKMLAKELEEHRAAYAKERLEGESGEAGLRYYLSLLSLKDVKNEMLEKSALKGDELKQRIGEIAAFFSNEKNLLSEAETAARAERRGILGLVEKIGQEWNTVKLRYKLGFAAAAIGLSVAVPPAGAAVMMIKRGLGGAGTFVALDAIFEKGMKKLWEQEERKAGESRMRAIGETLANEKQDSQGKKAIEKLNDFIDSDIKSLDREIKRRRMMGRVRKAVAFTAGAVVAIAPSFFQGVSDEMPQGEPMTVEDYYPDTGENSSEAVIAPETAEMPIVDAPAGENLVSPEAPAPEPIGTSIPSSEMTPASEAVPASAPVSAPEVTPAPEAPSDSEIAFASETPPSQGVLVDASDLDKWSLSSGPKPDDMMSLQRGGVMMGGENVASETGVVAGTEISPETQAEIARQEMEARAEAFLDEGTAKVNAAENVLDPNTAANQAYDSIVYGASPEAEAAPVTEMSIPDAGAGGSSTPDVSFEQADPTRVAQGSVPETNGDMISEQHGGVMRGMEGADAGVTQSVMESAKEGAAVASDAQAVMESVESSHVKFYLEQYPEKIEAFQESLAHYDTSIFGVESEGIAGRGVERLADLNPKVKAAQVMKDAIQLSKGIQGGLTPTFDIPTYNVEHHPNFDQMKGVAEFMLKSYEKIGKAALPLGHHESLRSYIERVTAILVDRDVKVKLNGDNRLLYELANRSPFDANK